MQAWRIYDQDAPWAAHPGFDPLDGEGAMHGPGRWHHKGSRVVYASATPSLALLEVLVHVDPADFGEQTLVRIEVPDDATETVTQAQLVQLLRDAPAERPELETRRFGSAWARERRSLALLVPSLVMPHDVNVVLNPLHPRMADVRRLGSERITLDPRLRLQRLRDEGAAAN